MEIQARRLPRLMAVGACLSLLAILLGFSLGGAFGAAESLILRRLDRSGTAVLQTVYQGDVAAKDAVVKRSWANLQRAHLHGGAIGTASLASILALVLLSRLGALAKASTLAFGSGALLYSLFWLVAGFTAPGLGGTGVAKESYSFIAIPGAGLCILGLLGTILSVVKAGFYGAPEG